MPRQQNQQLGQHSKRCSSCGLVKPLDQFHRDASKPDGRVHLCKPCWSQYQKQRRARKSAQPPADPSDIVPDDMKRCSGCGRVLPLDSFRRNKGKPKGVVAYCHECDRVVMAESKQRRRARRALSELKSILGDHELVLERKRFQQKSYRLHRVKAECAVLNCHNLGLYHHMNYIDPEAVVPLCEDHHIDLHRFERLVKKVAQLLGIRVEDFVHMDLDIDEPEPPGPRIINPLHYDALPDDYRFYGGPCTLSIMTG